MTQDQKNNKHLNQDEVERRFADLARSLGEESTAEKIPPAPSAHWSTDPAKPSKNSSNRDKEKTRWFRKKHNTTDNPHVIPNKSISNPRNYTIDDDYELPVDTDDYPHGHPSGQPPAQPIKLPKDRGLQFAIGLFLVSILWMLLLFFIPAYLPVWSAKAIIGLVFLAGGIFFLRLPNK